MHPFAPFILGGILLSGGAAATYAVVTTSGPLRQTSGPTASMRTTAEMAAPEQATVSTLTNAALQRGVLPGALASGPSGELYVADTGHRQIVRLEPTGNVQVVAGSGAEGITDGVADQAEFVAPGYIAVDATGAVYVSDGASHRIRKVDASGQVTTFAGGGPVGLGQGDFRDANGLDARFNLPAGIAFDALGNLIVADKDNNRIRRISSTGDVSTVAGTGKHGAQDGPVKDATFSAPVAVAIDKAGVIYVTEHGNNSIRRIAVDGIVSTVAKSVPAQFSGSSAPLSLSYPSGIAVADDGTLYVADTQAHRILKINPAGVGSVTAGAGTCPGFVDGNGSQAEFHSPVDLTFLSPTQLAVADRENGRIRIISLK